MFVILFMTLLKILEPHITKSINTAGFFTLWWRQGIGICLFTLKEQGKYFVNVSLIFCCRLESLMCIIATLTRWTHLPSFLESERLQRHSPFFSKLYGLDYLHVYFSTAFVHSWHSILQHQTNLQLHWFVSSTIW